MKTIKLFANCNPLQENCFFCVESSDSYCRSSNPERYKCDILPQSIEKLKGLGFKFYVVEEEERFFNYEY